MTMQDNIDIIRRNFGRDGHEPKLQTFASKIDNQRPIRVPIAISAHNAERRTDRFEVERNRRFANVAEMPDLVRLSRKIEDLWRQLVVRICDYENPYHLLLSASPARTEQAHCFKGMCSLVSSCVIQ